MIQPVRPNAHVCRMEVRFVDIDVMGHVNNAVYLNYFEQARMHFFAAKIGTEWDWVNHGILLARNEVEYKQPTRLHEDVHIEVWIGKVGGKSLEMEYEVFVPSGNDRILKAFGKSVLVCFDYKQQCTIPIPEQWRAAFV
ncbi:MAG TPA: acyl-CoA thioesterase [Flavobacteriales bacterium]|nr:esterase [Flavobacteriales bacterium]HRE74855.1 acyl-CoA thioesterase [Flavobacteriales bacterium]HRE96970.1 acyl-CoA thioesterase [Flavobacteriales bacterium]HRJ36542.1 acyl-CoA thioesterase [Flavobacteriales bacterium]HRJ37920.1 acyl-CoA thioesterase [Flavobacteriales bacterium]